MLAMITKRLSSKVWEIFGVEKWGKPPTFKKKFPISTKYILSKIEGSIALAPSTIYIFSKLCDILLRGFCV